MVACSEKVQRAIGTFYYKWGHFVGRKPKTTIACSTVVALLLCLRLFLIPVVGPLPAESRQEYLFAPQDSVGFLDFQRYNAMWGAGYRYSIFYITAKEAGGNVLTSSVLCLLYTSPSPRDRQKSRMPSSA